MVVSQIGGTPKKLDVLLHGKSKIVFFLVSQFLGSPAYPACYPASIRVRQDMSDLIEGIWIKNKVPSDPFEIDDIGCVTYYP